MIHRDQTILAINPGTRYLGLAVFDGAELIDRRIRMIRRNDPHLQIERVRAVIQDYLRRYHPDIVVIKRLEPRHRSARLDRVSSELARLGKRSGARIHHFSLQEIRRSLAPEQGVNKRGLIEQAVASYPTLHAEFDVERVARNLYHTRMLEAVVLGMACRRRWYKD